MKRITASMLVVLWLTVLTGCGAAAKMSRTNSPARTDVFAEVTEAGAIPQGFADLIVKTNIKTHEPSYYAGESTASLHGKAGYPFVLSIDGQDAVWKVDGWKEVKPAYDGQGKTSKDPEASAGIKYVLEKKLRLRHGTHKVYFGLPEEEYHDDAEITLREGEEAVLEFRPVYRDKTSPTRIPTFLKGISTYEIYLNAVKLN